MTSEKDKNHKVGQEEVDNAGFIPYIQINQYFNPGALYERYLSYLPTPDSGSAYLFNQPKVLSKTFNFMDPDCKVFYEAKKKVGINTVRNMLPELCIAVGAERQTNHQGIELF